MRGPLAFVLLAVVILAVFANLLWTAGYQQGEARIRGEEAARYYESDAEAGIERECLGLHGSDFIDCVRLQVEASREHTRAEQDLQTQQQMAIFTLWMAGTGILGLIFGALSIWLIYATLRASQGGVDAAIKAAEAANEANALMRSGQRPWLIVKTPEITDITELGSAGFVKQSGERIDLTKDYRCFRTSISIEICNSGAVPAFNVRVSADAVNRYLPEGSYPAELTPATWMIEDDVRVADIGVEQHFRMFSKYALGKGNGPGNFTIGQGQSVSYRPQTGPMIKVRKSMSHRAEDHQVLAIHIAYQGPDKAMWFHSNFAFDVVNQGVLGIEHYPPLDDPFAKADEIYFRLAEGDAV